MICPSCGNFIDTENPTSRPHCGVKLTAEIFDEIQGSTQPPPQPQTGSRPNMPQPEYAPTKNAKTPGGVGVASETSSQASPTPPSVADALREASFEEAVRTIESSPMSHKFDKYTLSQGWFLKKKLFGGYDGFKATDICWVYTHRLTEKMNFSTTGIYWSLHMKIRPNKEISIFRDRDSSTKKQEAVLSFNVDYTFRKLGQIVPWAFFGYSVLTEECWKKFSPLFLGIVDKRIAMIRMGLQDGSLLIRPGGLLTVTNRAFYLPGISWKFEPDGKGKPRVVYEMSVPQPRQKVVRT